MSVPTRTPAELQVISMVRWLLVFVFIVLGYMILRRVGPVLTPLIAAGAIAYLLDGWVDALVARGMNRTAVVALLLVGFIGGLVALAIFALPLISAELVHLVQSAPRMLAELSVWVEANFGVEIPASWQDYMATERAEELLGEYVGPAANVTAAAVGGLFSFVGTLAHLLLIPVFAFYILVDWDHIVERGRQLIPPRHRASVTDVVREIDAAVSTWIRGQLIVVAILAVLYAVAFRIIGIHLGVTIGAVVGLLTIIPFLGTVFGALLTGVLMVLDWQGPGQLGAVAGVFVVLHLLEASFLTPKIVGKKVGLGEVGALFAVVAGGELLGFVGVLLAVPIAAAVAVLVRRAHWHYRGSLFFADEHNLVADGAALSSPPPAESTGEEPADDDGDED